MSYTDTTADGVYLFPTSFAQQGMLILDQMSQGGYSYNVYRTFRFTGVLNLAALTRALDTLVERHESLRTHFESVDGDYMQIVAEAQPPCVPLTDLSGLPDAEREIEIDRLIGDEAYRPFDLLTGPLFRVQLLELSDTEHLLLLNMHHIISDGWSMDVLFRDLSVLYNAYERGEESPLSELPIQYADFAVWQRDYLQGEVLAEQLTYWKERLHGAPATLELPTDHPRPSRRSNKGAVHTFTFPSDLSEQLKQFSNREGMTLYTTLLTGFMLLLSRWSGEEDIVVGTPIAGRTRTEVEHLIGFFVNVLPVRVDVSGSLSFRELLERVRKTSLEAYSHQDVPFGMLVRELQPERNLSHSPIYQVVFQVQNAGEPLSLTNLQTSVRKHRTRTSKFDLSVTVGELSGAGIGGAIEYNLDLFDAPTITRLIEHFENLLQGVVADPSQLITEVPILSTAERRQIVSDWNDTVAEYPRAQSIVQLFEGQVERIPNAIAIRHEAVTLSYAELNSRANRLAHQLTEQQVGPETLVAICMERGIDIVVAMLATLKAGAAYVPIDPQLPVERIKYLLSHTGASVMLTVARHLEVLAHSNVIAVDANEEVGSYSDVNLPVSVTGKNLAYVMYTSGSTGKPKGVAITHENLSWLVHNLGQLEIRLTDTVAFASHPSFDAVVYEVWGALVHGAQIEVIARETILSAAQFSQKLKESGISVLYLTAAVFTQLASQDATIFANLRTVVSGGESIANHWAREVLEQGPPQRLIHEYGPTETTVFSSIHPVQHVGATERNLPIGRPLGNTTSYVLDRQMQPVPVGVSGELYIGGDGIARGYWRAPEETAQRFVPNLFSQQGGERLYRTGDIVRYWPTGEIEFIGRQDQQVKLRGMRVELEEIETVLGEHPQVKAAKVIVHDQNTDEARLVAYVAGEAAEFSESRIKVYLKERLPDYMVPAVIVRLDSFPLTANGKVDQSKLAAPAKAQRDEADYVAPRTTIEEILCDLWADVLRIELVGVDDNFFDLGGHSLLVTLVVSRIRELFKVELSLRTLFEQPTVAALANEVEQALRQGTAEIAPLERVSRDQVLPLSFAQQRLWLIDQMEPGTPVYNIPWARSLVGDLNVTALERALSEIVRRHESLRTTFETMGGEARQIIAETEPVKLATLDISDQPGAEEEAQRLANEEASHPFDLARGPLFRARLVKVDEQQHVLMLTMHHIVSDGWSMGLLFTELSQLYNAFARGEESPLPEPVVQYADYAVWQRESLRGEMLARQLDYWRRQLGESPRVLELPTDRTRPAIRSFRGATETFRLPEQLSRQLRELSQREGTTLFMTLLAIFQLLLSRYTEQEEVLVGTTIAGRNRSEVESLIGFFVNTLVMRGDLSGNPNFLELLGRTREACLGAYTHQDLPFDKLVEELHPSRSVNHQPLCQVGLQLANNANERLSFDNLRVKPLRQPSETTKLDLLFSMAEMDSELQGSIQYSTDLFEATTIRRMIEHFEGLLEAAVANPERRISQLSLLSETERRQIVEEFNRTETDYPHPNSIVELFEAHVERNPESIALESEGVSLTYHQLDQRANQLGHYLRKLGVGPEVVVGVSLPRSPETIISILGILKAGGAYLPLDPSHPAERIAHMTQLAEPLVVLSEDTDWELIAGESSACPASAVRPDNLAYVIFTSGSTGRPKGVAVPHRGLCNSFFAHGEYFQLQPGDRVIQFSSVNFDGSMFEILMTLCSGATLFVPRQHSLMAGSALVELLRNEQITMAAFPPSVVASLPAQSLPDLRTMIVAGEAVNEEIVEQCAGDRNLLNLYGPTEATITATGKKCETGGGKPSIGKPINNGKIYLLNQRQQLVPVGVPGEICIGGAGVTRGYINQFELTAERFVPDEFSGVAGARLYRTGDLAKYNSSGEIEFLGRMDDQVKLRGFRIELGEIEAVLCAHEQVRKAVVVVSERAQGEKQLAAYLVKEGAAELSSREVRAFLSERLPEYMMPAAFVWLEELPLTTNGKVDRRALPEPQWETLGAGGEYVAPRTPLEEVLAGIWCEVLNIERVSIYVDFFEIGGHSLLAMLTTSRIREMFQWELSLQAIFQCGTIARLAEHIESHATAAGVDVETVARVLVQMNTLSEEEIQTMLIDREPVAV